MRFYLATFGCAFSLAAAILTAGTFTASAMAATCHAQGRSVPASIADEPDFKVDLQPGEQITLPLNLALSLTETHAYSYPSGGATRQYRCTARHGVDIYDEWRTPHGKVVARFDGITFKAVRPALIYAWHG